MNFRLILMFTFFVQTGFTESLQNMFDTAVPSEGYDRYIILHPDTIYFGGIGIFEDSVFIEGNGAVIELENGSGIWIYGDSESMGSLNINRCTIKNGAYYGLNYSGISTGSITNCNIVNSEMGIQLMDTSITVIKNCNLIDNNVYGIAVYSTNPAVEISYCNTWNNGEDYMENCPG